MPFPDYMEALNSTCVSVFGNNGSTTAPQVTYQAQVGESYSLNGIVVDPSELDDLSLGGYALRLSVTTTDFASPPARGDLVTIGTVQYRVQNLLSDSGGMTELFLRFASPSP